MTHRQAALWAHKIIRYENTNRIGHYDVQVKVCQSGWYIAIQLSEERYNLYTPKECRLWLTDRY